MRVRDRKTGQWRRAPWWCEVAHALTPAGWALVLLALCMIALAAGLLAGGK